MNFLLPLTVLVAMAAAAVVALIAPSTETFILLLSTQAVLPIAVIGYLQNREDLFSPSKVFTYVMIFSVPLFCAYVLFMAEPARRDYAMFWQETPSLISGIMVIAISSIAFGFGVNYAVSLPGTKIGSARASLNISHTKLRIFALFVCLIGGYASYQFASSVNIFQSIAESSFSTKRVHVATVGVAPRGSALTHWRILGISLPHALLLVYFGSIWIGYIKPKLMDYALLLMLFLISMVIPLLASSRTPIIEISLLLIMLRHYLFRRTNILRMGVFSFGAVGLLGILGQIRTFSNQGSFSGSRIFEQIVGNAYFIDLGKTSIIINRVPEQIDYLLGYSFSLAAYMFIPRQIWPEKPIVRIGYFVGQELIQLNNQTGIPPGMIAELYMNFGPVGSVLGLFLIGVVAASLYRAMKRSKFSLRETIVYVVGINVIIFAFLSGDFVYGLLQMLTYIVLIKVAYFWSQPFSVRKVRQQ